jgi:Peptidase family C25/Propeptide_C25
MPQAVPRSLATTVGLALLLLTLAFGGGQALAAKSPSAGPSLKSLVRQTNALPRTAASPAKRRALKRAAGHARRVARKRPCAAVRDLARFRRVLGRVKVRKAKGKRRRRATQRLAALAPASLRSSRLLLASKRTKRCGGGVGPNRRSNTKTTVLSSDENGMRVRVELPAVKFVPESGGGKTWTKLALPNTDVPGKPGTPGIPVASSTLGVPDGASLEIKSGNVEKVVLDGVDVFPVQPEPVDAVTQPPDFAKPPFAAKPFAISGKAYSARGLVPAKPADADMLGESRDLDIGALQVPAVQYDPKAKKLVVLSSVDVTLTFKGGAHKFSDQLGSPWEQTQRRLAATLLNADLLEKLRPPIVVQPCGEEMLVITNPATRAAADTFAAARRAAGLRTSVRETGAGAGQIGTTAAAIQSFIRGRLTSVFCIRPSYVTIVGDDELVPTFTATPGGIPSDLQYSMKNDADELPDVAVGRIFGNDLAQVTAAVNKIVAYETTAPTGTFLTRATLAAQFQDDDDNGTENRTFIQFAETVRNGLVNRGVTVDRIYDDSPAATPLKFNDGTDLPAALKKPTFAWDGDGADVTAAWNDGRFLVVHRDHGWSDGWGHPGYNTANVDALTNGGELPVVMSINCSSAAYDYDETSFAQNALVKPDGGAVGVFGDTRDSPSWHNSQIALGFVDGLLPSVLPAEGPALKQRTGDALINGKLRLAGLAPPSGPGITGGDGSTRNELYLWHYFGDPSMQMWGGGNPPIVFDPNVFKAVYKELANPPIPGPPPYLVEVTLPAGLAGQPIGLLRNGEVIGKAIAGNGVASIPATFGDGAPKPGELSIALEADGAQPVSAPVDGVPKAPTTLAQSCPDDVPFGSEAEITVSGTLAGAPAGSTVDVKFEAPDGFTPGRTVMVPATVDAQGEWTATVTTTDHGEIGDWTVSSGYAGTAQHAPAQAGPCTVTVFDNS